MNSTIKNRSQLVLVALIIVVMLFTAGCLAYRYTLPYKRYDHDQHEMALLDDDKDCFVCHRVDINEPDLKKKLDMLKETLKLTYDKQYESDMCHNCHIDGRVDGYQVAPKNCKFCHEELLEILPEDHDGIWRETHNIKARVEDKMCMRCHDRWYCNDCHTSNDLSKANMHPRIFRVSHIPAAMADPASCSSCHRNSFCIDCHTSR